MVGPGSHEIDFILTPKGELTEKPDNTMTGGSAFENPPKTIELYKTSQATPAALERSSIRSSNGQASGSLCGIISTIVAAIVGGGLFTEHQAKVDEEVQKRDLAIESLRPLPPSLVLPSLPRHGSFFRSSPSSFSRAKAKTTYLIPKLEEQPPTTD
ncbi:MAG: hypothetical protein Q9212_007035 [Teloschistes hypoglaucus]